MTNKAFYERRLEEHKRLYQQAVKDDNVKEIKRQAQEMNNMKALIESAKKFEGLVV
jgi:hypothetical protein